MRNSFLNKTRERTLYSRAFGKQEGRTKNLWETRQRPKEQSKDCVGGLKNSKNSTASKLTWVALGKVRRETGQKAWNTAICVGNGSGYLEIALTRRANVAEGTPRRKCDPGKEGESTVKCQEGLDSED